MVVQLRAGEGTHGPTHTALERSSVFPGTVPDPTGLFKQGGCSADQLTGVRAKLSHPIPHVRCDQFAEPSTGWLSFVATMRPC